MSYHYGLTGPSVVVDTACSSSLVALSLARQALLPGGGGGGGGGEAAAGAALVAGVNAMLSPATTAMFKAAGARLLWGLGKRPVALRAALLAPHTALA